MSTSDEGAALEARVEELSAQLARAEAALADAREREVASAGVLRVIAASPSNLDAVVAALAERAAALTEAGDAQVFLGTPAAVRVAAT